MLRRYLYVLAALLFVLSSSVVFAQENTVPGWEGQGKILIETMETVQLSPTFSFNYPSQVQRYRFSCTSATYVRVGIGDRAIAGDIWGAHVKIHDRNPTSTGVLATGAATGYNYTYLYNFGPSPFQGLIEVRYERGIDNFPAAGQLDVYCNGSLLVLTTLPISEF